MRVRVRIVILQVCFRCRNNVRVNGNRHVCGVCHLDVHCQFDFARRARGNDDFFRVRGVADGKHNVVALCLHAHFADCKAAHGRRNDRHNVNHVRRIRVDLHAVYLSAPFLIF